MKWFWWLCVLCGLTLSAQQSQWLYVRVRSEAVPLLQTRTLQLGSGLTIEQPLLLPEQRIRQQLQRGAAQVQSATQLAAIERAEEPLLRTLRVRYDGELPADKVCAALMADNPHVEYAEPARRQRLLVTPNDPLFPQQLYLQAIEAPAAWDVTTGSSSVLIGISDSGVRISHEDLASAVAINTAEIPNNGIDDDGNGYIDDYRGYNFSWRSDQTAPDNVFHPTDGHGTEVAGIVAATQNNGKGISGIAPGCRIVPIKATPNALDGTIIFGYESLIYAAVRGCKVVNCSWGNEDQAPSPIERSIIEYAIARDVAIVAASGNGTGTQPMYPAAYPGVLGVGETEVDGTLVPGTGIGAHCRILAPGSSARTTGNATDADYTYISGTSSAAPMVSAVVALVRSRYPQLTALQAIEQVRLAAQDVSSRNPELHALLPGMVNARRAVERDPFSTPAIVPRELRLTRLDGSPIERTAVGDTVLVYVDAVNRLGSGTQLQFQLSAYQSSGTQATAVHMLDATVTRAHVASGEELTIGPFSMAVVEPSAELHFLRLDITGTGSGREYRDFALLPFYPTPDWVTLRRDSLTISVGDYGWLGRNVGSGLPSKGEGLSSPRVGSVLYGGGVYCVHFPSGRVRSGIEGDAGRSSNDFVPTVQQTAEYSCVRILRDTTSSTGPAIGLRLEERFEVLDSATVRVSTTLTNISGAALSDVAIGYFFDFDLTSTGDSCAVGVLIDRSHACAEIMERTPADPVVAVVAQSSAADAQPQCAGLDPTYASASNFLPERKMEVLRSGTSRQSPGLGDKSIVTGMRFTGTLAPGESRACELYVVVGRSRSQVRERAEQLLSVESDGGSSFRLMPQPAVGAEAIAECAAVRGRSSRWRLYSLDGRILWSAEFVATPERIEIPIAALPSGIYCIQLEAAGLRAQQLVVRVRP